MEHFRDTKVCTNVAHFAKNTCKNLMFYSIIKNKSFPYVCMFFLQDLTLCADMEPLGGYGVGLRSSSPHVAMIGVRKEGL